MVAATYNKHEYGGAELIAYFTTMYNLAYQKGNMQTRMHNFRSPCDGETDIWIEDSANGHYTLGFNSSYMASDLPEPDNFRTPIRI